MTDLVNATTFGISATLPATIDTAGYDAVSFVIIGDVIEYGGMIKTYNSVAHQTVTLRHATNLKGTFTVSNATMSLGRAIADAGQVLLQAAHASDDSYSFEITLPSGNVERYTGKVLTAGTGSIAADGVETTEVEIVVDPISILEE